MCQLATIPGTAERSEASRPEQGKALVVIAQAGLRLRELDAVGQRDGLRAALVKDHVRALAVPERLGCAVCVCCVRRGGGPRVSLVQAVGAKGVRSARLAVVHLMEHRVKMPPGVHPQEHVLHAARVLCVAEQ